MKVKEMIEHLRDMIDSGYMLETDELVVEDQDQIFHPILGCSNDLIITVDWNSVAE